MVVTSGHGLFEQASAEDYDHRVKDSLESKLAERGSTRTAHDVTATIKAFRRRIDLVISLIEAIVSSTSE